MNYSVYLRPISIDDANISYKWRNNPLVWQYTEFKPTQQVTKDMEAAWLARVLRVKNDRRFAICLKEDKTYLGNIQLINIRRKSASFHLFIGDPFFWGKGIGKEATSLMLEYGFQKLGLRCIMLEVHQENLSAQSVYKKSGFEVFNKRGVFIGMCITRKRYVALQQLGPLIEENSFTHDLMYPVSGNA